MRCRIAPQNDQVPAPPPASAPLSLLRAPAVAIAFLHIGRPATLMPDRRSRRLFRPDVKPGIKPGIERTAGHYGDTLTRAIFGKSSSANGFGRMITSGFFDSQRFAPVLLMFPVVLMLST